MVSVVVMTPPPLSDGDQLRDPGFPPGTRITSGPTGWLQLEHGSEDRKGREGK